jgi:hypothetical protein
LLRIIFQVCNKVVREKKIFLDKVRVFFVRFVCEQESKASDITHNSKTLFQFNFLLSQKNSSLETESNFSYLKKKQMFSVVAFSREKQC